MLSSLSDTPGQPNERQGASRNLRLFLKMPTPESKKGPIRLVKIFGLDVYSGVLLGKRARIEMNFAAALLAVVGLFELCAWSFLFNAIFNADMFHPGFGTIWAVLVACFFASIVFWFERQLLTLDEIRRGNARWAMAARLTYILVAAYITAQPLELLAFRRPIKARIHAEGIRENAASALSALLQDERRDNEQSSFSESLPSSDYTDAQGRLNNALSALKDLDLALRLQESKVANFTALERQLRAALSRRAAVSRSSAAGQFREHESPQSQEELAARYRQASDQLQEARTKQEQLKVRREVLKAEADRLAGEKQAAGERWQRVRADFQKRKELEFALFREWVEALQQTKVGKPVEVGTLHLALHYAAQDKVPLERAQRWRFVEPEYDFFEQLRVLSDLRSTRPPRWLTGSPEVVHQLETDYGLRSVKACDDVHAGPTATSAGKINSSGTVPCDAREWEDEKDRSAIYRRSYYAVLLTALFIPCLVLTIKFFLMPEELRRYYSSRHQAAAGDPDALLGALVEERVNGRETHHGY